MRTAANLATVAFLCLRYVPDSSVTVQSLGMWALVSASVVVVTARRRYERVSEHFGAGRVVYPFLLMLGLAVTVVGLARGVSRRDPCRRTVTRPHCRVPLALDC